MFSSGLQPVSEPAQQKHLVHSKNEFRTQKKGKTKDSIQQTALSILFGIVITGISFKHIFFQEDQSTDIPRQCENLYYMYIYDNAQK